VRPPLDMSVERGNKAYKRPPLRGVPAAASPVDSTLRVKPPDDANARTIKSASKTERPFKTQVLMDSAGAVEVSKKPEPIVFNETVCFDCLAADVAEEIDGTTVLEDFTDEQSSLRLFKWGNNGRMSVYPAMNAYHNASTRLRQAKRELLKKGLARLAGVPEELADRIVLGPGAKSYLCAKHTESRGAEVSSAFEDGVL
jgi:hypothetical protein